MPQRDYYGIMGVARTASAEQIREGYRRVAMKWHPQKNPGSKVEAEQRFRDIAEAYDVLIDPLRRRRYDDLGEKGLKFPPLGCDADPYQYVGDPLRLFSDFFSAANPLAAAYEEDYEGRAPSLACKVPDETIEMKVPCTLQELQEGATRRIVVRRMRLGPDNKPFEELKPMSVPVRPGWQEGMRVTFRGEGSHSDPAKQAGDLIFVIEEKPFPGSGEVRQTVEVGDEPKGVDEE